MKVSILCDQTDSFFLEYIDEVKQIILGNGDQFEFVDNIERIRQGDLLIAASARSILRRQSLSLNKKNIVIHPSKLPRFRGSGVVAWSIIEGASEISVTSFEATEEIDGGPIILQTSRALTGYELCDEIRHLQASMYLDHIKFLIKGNWASVEQPAIAGKMYPRRTPLDSELDIDKSLREQFNLLRVCDNARYPAFFNIDGHKYYLKITKS